LASRFVILRHETPPGYRRPLHWDLMLKLDGALTTWALDSAPEIGATLAAEQLADHRLEYLEIEGAVGGDRGRVSQFDVGEFVLLERTSQRLRAELRGRRLQSQLALSRQGDGPLWQATFSPLEPG